MTDLPRKAVVRSAKLASVPLGFAGRTALGLGKRLGGRPAEMVAAELQARTAQQLFQVLGELKGGAMKFGQALSIFEAALPEDLAVHYRATLTKLQDSAPPMPTSSVHGVLRADLGTRWRSKFTSFDDHPVASASIGQVHRAVWKDGRDVAVKIQYPGAGAALMSDIRQISRVAKVAAGWVPGIELGPILDELRDRMAEELDYRLEAESQATFAAAFEDDPDFAVPRVVEGREHVIVSEWLDGLPLSRIIAEGTQEQRDTASQLYLRFLLAGPARAGLLHADPHPGNFRITPDGRLGVIDFGAVNRLPDGMPPEIGPLLTTGLEGSAEDVLEGLREIGFVKERIELDPQRLLDYLEPFMAPFRTDTFTFSRDWLRGVFAHINDPRQPNYAVAYKLNLPPEYLLIHRVWGGGIGVLSQLGGTVHGRAIVDELLPGAELPPVDSND
ncbi:ABC transporter ATP-binding protein [Terrabacter tumescens]|uniref:ABC transporter ATP-binding protein n=1 Tax=Terrabacter tumescens TaxID=60443 RepID=A0ABQ2HWL4_9MICO|nr:AarF/ABC1/UbiB kinase family protein [Terrabacter tumescens]GGM91944.1 ABC transporter ATP-binding protein [Terrabacter tumescens]